MHPLSHTHARTHTYTVGCQLQEGAGAGESGWAATWKEGCWVGPRANPFLTCKIGFIPPRTASRIKEDKKFSRSLNTPGLAEYTANTRSVIVDRESGSRGGHEARISFILGCCVSRGGRGWWLYKIMSLIILLFRLAFTIHGTALHSFFFFPPTPLSPGEG